MLQSFSSDRYLYLYDGVEKKADDTPPLHRKILAESSKKDFMKPLSFILVSEEIILVLMVRVIATFGCYHFLYDTKDVISLLNDEHQALKSMGD